MKDQELLGGGQAAPTASPRQESTMAAPISMGEEIAKAKATLENPIVVEEEETPQEFLSIENTVFQEQEDPYKDYRGKAGLAVGKAVALTVDSVKASNSNSFNRMMGNIIRAKNASEVTGYSNNYLPQHTQEVMEEAKEKLAEQYDKEAKDAYYRMQDAQEERSNVLSTIDNKPAVLGLEFLTNATDYMLNYENFTVNIIGNMLGVGVGNALGIASKPMKLLAGAITEANVGSAWDVYTASENTALVENRTLFAQEMVDIYKDNLAGELAMFGVIEGGKAAFGKFMKTSLDGKVNQYKAYGVDDANIKKYAEGMGDYNNNTAELARTTIESLNPNIAKEKMVVLTDDNNVIGGAKHAVEAIENAREGNMNVANQYTFTKAMNTDEVNVLQTSYDVNKDPYIHNNGAKLVLSENVLTPTVEADPSIVPDTGKIKATEIVEKGDYVLKNYPYRSGIVEVEIPKLVLTPEEKNSTYLRVTRADANSRVIMTDASGVKTVLTGEEKLKFGQFGVARQEATDQVADWLLGAGRELEDLDQAAEAIAMRKYGDPTKAKVDFNKDYMLNSFVTDWYDGKVAPMYNNLAREKWTIIDDIVKKHEFRSGQHLIDSYTPTELTTSFILGRDVIPENPTKLTPRQLEGTEKFSEMVNTIGKEHEAKTQRNHKTYYVDAYEDITKLKSNLFEFGEDGQPRLKSTQGTILENGETYAKIHAITNKHLADVPEYTRFKDIDLMDSADIWMTFGSIEDGPSMAGLGVDLMVQKGKLSPVDVKIMESYGMLEAGDRILVEPREFLKAYNSMLADYPNMDEAAKKAFNRIQTALADNTTLPPHIDFQGGQELETPMSLMDWFESVEDNQLLTKTKKQELLKNSITEMRDYIDSVNEFNQNWNPELEGLKAKGKDIDALSKSYAKVEKYLEALESDKDISRTMKSKRVQDLANDLAKVNEEFNLGLTPEDLDLVKGALNSEGYAEFKAKKAELEQNVVDKYNESRAKVNTFVEQTNADINEVKNITKDYIDKVNAQYAEKIEAIKDSKRMFQAPEAPAEIKIDEYKARDQYDLDVQAIQAKNAELKSEWEAETAKTSGAPELPFQEYTQMSNVDDALKSEDGLTSRDSKVEVRYMTPDEYVEHSAKGFGMTPEDVVAQRNRTRNYKGEGFLVDKYAEDMKNGDKFPLPHLEDAQKVRTERASVFALGDELDPKELDVNYDPNSTWDRQGLEYELKRYTDVEIDWDPILSKEFKNIEEFTEDLVETITRGHEDLPYEIDDFLDSKGMSFAEKRQVTKQIMEGATFKELGIDLSEATEFYSALRNIYEQILPTVDNEITSFSQEGLHRALAAKQLGYEYIPVAVEIGKSQDFGNYGISKADFEARNKKSGISSSWDTIETKVKDIQNNIQEDILNNLLKEGKPFGTGQPAIAMREGEFNFAGVLIDDEYPATVLTSAKQKKESLQEMLGLVKDKLSAEELKDMGFRTDKDITEEILKNFTTLDKDYLNEFNLRDSDVDPNKIDNAEVALFLQNIIQNNKEAYTKKYAPQLGEINKLNTEWENLKNQPTESIPEPKYQEIPDFDINNYPQFKQEPWAWAQNKDILYKAPKDYNVDYTLHNDRDFSKGNLLDQLKRDLQLPEDLKLGKGVKIAGGVDKAKIMDVRKTGEGNQAQITKVSRKWITTEGGHADLEFMVDGKKMYVSANLIDGKWQGDFYAIGSAPRGVKGDTGNLKNLTAERRSKIADIKEKSAGKIEAIKELNVALKDLDKTLKDSSKSLKDIDKVDNVLKQAEYIQSLQKEIYGADYKGLNLENFPEIVKEYFDLEDFKSVQAKNLRTFADRFKEGFEQKKLASQKFQQEFYTGRVQELKKAWKDLRTKINTDVNDIPRMLDAGEIQDLVTDIKGILEDMGEKSVNTRVLDSIIDRYTRLVDVVDRGGANPVLNSPAASKRKTVIDSKSRMQMAKLGLGMNKEHFLKDRGWFKAETVDKKKTYAISKVADIREMTPEVLAKTFDSDYIEVLDALYNKVEAEGIKLNVMDENGEAIPMDINKFAYWYYRFLEDLNKTKRVTDMFSPDKKLELGHLIPFFESKDDFLKFMTIDDPKIGRTGYIKDNAQFIENYFGNELRGQAEQLVFGTSGMGMMRNIATHPMLKDSMQQMDGDFVTKSGQLLKGVQTKLQNRAEGYGKVTRAQESNEGTKARKLLSGMIKVYLSRSGAKEAITNSYHSLFRSYDILGTKQYLAQAPKTFARGIANSVVDILDFRKTMDYVGLFGRMIDNEKLVSMADRAFKPVELFPSKNSLVDAELGLDKMMMQAAYQNKGLLERNIDAVEYWMMQNQTKSDWGRKSGSFITADTDLKVIGSGEQLPKESLYRFKMAGIGDADIPYYRTLIGDLDAAGINPYDFNQVLEFLGTGKESEALKLTTLTNNIVAENFRAGRAKDVAGVKPKSFMEESLMAFRGFVVNQGTEDLLKLKYKKTKYGVPVPRIDYARDGFMEASKQVANASIIGGAHFIGNGLGTLMSANMLRATVGGIAGWATLAKSWAELETSYEESKDYGWYNMLPFMGSVLIDGFGQSTLGVYGSGGNIVVDAVSDVKRASKGAIATLAKFVDVSPELSEAMFGMSPEELEMLDYTQQIATRNALLRYTGLSVPLKGVFDWDFYVNADPRDRERYKQSMYNSFRKKNQGQYELIKNYEGSLDKVFKVIDGIINKDPKVTSKFNKIYKEEMGDALKGNTMALHDGMNVVLGSAVATGEITPDEYTSIREDVASKTDFDVIWSKDVPKPLQDLGNKIADFIGSESLADNVDIKRQTLALAEEGKSPAEIKDTLTEGQGYAVDKFVEGKKALSPDEKNLMKFFIKEFGLPEDKVRRAVTQGLNFDQMLEEFDEAIAAKIATDATAPEQIKDNIYFKFTDNVEKNARANQIFAIAKPIAEEFGIDVRQLMAQWALESAWGTSGTGALAKAKNAHALFGIKAMGWAGKVVELPTSEVVSYDAYNKYWKNKGFKIVGNVDGKVKIQGTEKFRAYDSLEEAVRDYASLIKRKYPTVESLRKYATDGTYVNQIRKLINQFGTNESYESNQAAEDWVNSDIVSGVATLGDPNWREKVAEGMPVDSVDYELKEAMAKAQGTSVTPTEEGNHTAPQEVIPDVESTQEIVASTGEGTKLTAEGEFANTSEVPEVEAPEEKEEVTPAEAVEQSLEIPEPQTERVEEILKPTEGALKDELESKLVNLLTNKEILPANMDGIETASLKDISLGDLMPEELDLPKNPDTHLKSHSSNREEISMDLGLTPEDLEDVLNVPINPEKAKEINEALAQGTLEQAVETLKSVKESSEPTPKEEIVKDKTSRKAKPFDPETTKYEDIGKDFEAESEPTKANASDVPSGKTMTPVPKDITFEYAKYRDAASVNINNAVASEEATIELREKYGDIVALSERDWLNIKDNYRKDFKEALNEIKKREGEEYFKHAGKKVSKDSWTPADKRYHSRVSDRFGKQSEISADEYARISDRLEAYEAKVEKAYKKESKEEQIVIKRDLEKGIAHNNAGKIALINRQIDRLIEAKGKDVIKTKEFKELKAKESVILKEMYKE